MVLNVTEIGLFVYTDQTTLDFCLCVWMNSEVYKTKVDTPDELLASSLYADVCVRDVRIN
jgi:hypothetical protein